MSPTGANPRGSFAFSFIFLVLSAHLGSVFFLPIMYRQ